MNTALTCLLRHRPDQCNCITLNDEQWETYDAERVRCLRLGIPPPPFPGGEDRREYAPPPNPAYAQQPQVTFNTASMNIPLYSNGQWHAPAGPTMPMAPAPVYTQPTLQQYQPQQQQTQWFPAPAPPPNKKTQRRKHQRAKKAEAEKAAVTSSASVNKPGTLYLGLQLLLCFLILLLQTVGNPVRGTCGIPGNSEMHAYNGNMMPSSSSSATELEYVEHRGLKHVKLPQYKDGTNAIEWLKAFIFETEAAELTNKETRRALVSCLKCDKGRLFLMDPALAAEYAKADDNDINLGVIYNRFAELATGMSYTQAMQEELRQLTWDQSESLELFVYKCISLGGKTGITLDTEGKRLDLVKSKLPIDLVVALGKVVPALDTCAKVIGWVQLYYKPTFATNAIAKPDPIVVNLQLELKEVTDKLQSLQTTMDSQQQDGCGRGRGRGRGRGAGGKDKADGKQDGGGKPKLKWGEDGTCTSCGDPDHDKKGCPIWLNAVPCGLCNKLGHTGFVCRSSKK